MTEQTSTTVSISGKEKTITEADFLKRSKFSAQNFSEANNLIFRLISKNGEPMFSMPTDVRTDRVCIWIENNEVVRAVFT